MGFQTSQTERKMRKLCVPPGEHTLQYPLQMRLRRKTKKERSPWGRPTTNRIIDWGSTVKGTKTGPNWWTFSSFRVKVLCSFSLGRFQGCYRSLRTVSPSHPVPMGLFIVVNLSSFNHCMWCFFGPITWLFRLFSFVWVGHLYFMWGK